MHAGSTVDTASAPAGSRYRPSPAIILLACAVLACGVLLTLPLELPFGPMYWDLVVYLDAANRMAEGQQPLVDFFAPVGPLGYWLFSWLDGLFPHSQPLLLAQWCVLVVTAPAMAVVLHEVDRRSRRTALALLLPYLVFQLLPVNVEHYSFFPGTDGFGIYNRHVSILLYVLVSALVFLRRGRALIGVTLCMLTALLLIKITGFVAGGFVTAFAIAAGRFDPRQIAFAVATGALLLGGLELYDGIVSAYFNDIVALVAINAGSILPRFLQAASLHLDIMAAGSALVLVLALFGWRETVEAASAFRRAPSPAAAARLLDRDVAWLAVVLAAGLFFETQNTGGQAFIFAWPVLLSILPRWLGSGRRGALLVPALIAATALPPAETVLQRAGRAALAQTGYETLPNRHLGRLGLVSQHPEVIAHARTTLDTYAAHVETFRDIAARKILPGTQLYSDLAFQGAWLMAVDEGIDAILAHERKSGRRFETIMSLNFVNPFPFLMGRSAPRAIAIGADPFRAVPEPSAADIAKADESDLVLYPLCPVTVANEALREIYRPLLAGRQEIALGRCWKGYVEPARS